MSEETTKQRPAGRLASAVVALLLLPAVIAQAADVKLLSGSVPRVVSRLQAVGRVAATNRVNLSIGLSVRDQAGLTRFLTDISDPDSPNYRHYLTAAEFTTQFGPTAADYQAVSDWAQANGLTVGETSPNRMILKVSGPASTVENAFKVTLRTYQHPTENRVFFAADADPAVPATLPVLDIWGFSDYGRAHSNYRIKPAAGTSGGTAGASDKIGVPLAGSGPGSNYIGNDFRAAYAPGVALTGSGQTVALFQLDGYDANDIRAYEQLAGLPNVPLQNVLINGFNGQPSGNGGEIEVSLDIEMVISMAPGVSKILVYEGPNDIRNFFPNDILNRIATDNSARQISCSWGWIGGPNRTTDQIFQQMAAQGQTFFNASGDSDAFLPGEVDDPSGFGEPSSSAFITQVGGTTLKTASPGGPRGSETVWNWGADPRYDPVLNDGVGSSGGISLATPIPIWQMGVATAGNRASNTNRNIPDVALTADDVFVIADSGIEYPGTGGTSCAAPLWAGFMALVNQKAASNSKASAGFINPAIYAIAKSGTYAAAFNDITAGSNTWSMSPTNFLAKAGYDLCTGLGTPKGAVLINALAGISSCPAVGTLEAHITPLNGATFLAGTTEPIFVDVFDGAPVTNATVNATANGAGFTMNNAGTAPDLAAADYTYSGNLPIPAGTNQVTLRFVITAPGKVGITNVVVCNIIPSPVPNDAFAGAIKVPAVGGLFLSNNRLATKEPGETNLNELVTVQGTLWWKWIPTADTNVFINTLGSAAERVLVVYSNATPGFAPTLAHLGLVAVTNNIGAGARAQLNLTVQSNQTYFIMLGSPSTNVLGSLQLLIAPGGSADVVSPVLLVSTPNSGLGVTNGLLTFSGTASDPQPNASGVQSIFVSFNGQCDRLASGTTNWTSTIGLNPGFNDIDVYAVDVAGNVSAVSDIQISYVFIDPPNDFLASATVISNNSGTVSAVTTNATKEAGEPNHAGNTGGRSVWWSFTPVVDGTLFLTTSNSTFDTLLAIYSGNTVSTLTEVGSNDDAPGAFSGGASALTVGLRSNVTYYIAVDGYDGASGTATLQYAFSSGQLSHLSVTSSAGGTVGPQSMDAVDNTTVTLTAMPDPGFVFDVWDGDIVSFTNPLSIVVTGDTNVVASFVPKGFTEDFETGDFSKLPWSFSGSSGWFVQSFTSKFGQYAAESGNIGGNQSSSLVLSANFMGGMGSFDLRASTEASFDIASFYIDGVLQQSWSGDTGWFNYQFPITAGLHTLEWRYLKDASINENLDAVFLDNINLPLPGAHQYLRQLKDGRYFVDVYGTAGQNFTLQASYDLSYWFDVATGTTTNDFVHVLDVDGSGHPYRFWRTVITP